MRDVPWILIIGVLLIALWGESSREQQDCPVPAMTNAEMREMLDENQKLKSISPY